MNAPDGPQEGPAAAAEKGPEKIVEQIRYQIRNESVDELEIGKRLVASVDYIKVNTRRLSSRLEQFQ